MERYDRFFEFYKMNYRVIKITASYYNLTNKELEQECAIAYFESPEIEELLVSGERKLAYNHFMGNLRSNIKDFHISGRRIDRGSVYDEVRDWLNELGAKAEELVYPEKEIMRQLEMERIRGIYGDEYVDDILEYYELGYELYSMKHGKTGTASRQIISRKIKQIKEER